MFKFVEDQKAPYREDGKYRLFFFDVTYGVGSIRSSNQCRVNGEGFATIEDLLATIPASECSKEDAIAKVRYGFPIPGQKITDYPDHGFVASDIPSVAKYTVTGTGDVKYVTHPQYKQMIQRYKK